MCEMRKVDFVMVYIWYAIYGISETVNILLADVENEKNIKMGEKYELQHHQQQHPHIFNPSIQHMNDFFTFSPIRGDKLFFLFLHVL